VIGRQACEIIGSGENIRPLRDVLVLEPLEFKPSDSVLTVRHGRAVRGIVRAIGPGTYPRKYQVNAEGQKQSFTYSKHFQRTEVKVGDTVELGGLNAFDGEGYSFQEIVWNGKVHLVCQEADVAGVMT
jgi:hypothetical protein